MEHDKDPELEKAKADLVKAEKDLEKAEHEIDEALEEIKEAEEHHKEAKAKAKVEFEDVNSLETVDFRTGWDTKLNAAWDEAAKLLKEPRKPTDRLQTPGGVDLMPYLGLTLRELEEKKIVTALKFQIVGPTGGA